MYLLYVVHYHIIIDIDECGSKMDNCSEIPPAPAECINTDGGFRCACDNRLGFTLSANGTTCEGEPYIIIMDNILHLYSTPSLGFFPLVYTQ